MGDIDQLVAGGNAQLFGSVVNWINGEENAVVIDAKSMSAEYLTVPSTAVIGFGCCLWWFCPSPASVAGVVVFILRRRR